MASMMRAHVGPVVAFRGSTRVRDRYVAVKRGGSARSVGDRFRLGVGGCAMGHINGSKKAKRANAEERGVSNAANVMESALARTDISTAEATMEGSAMEGSRIESSTPTIGTTLQLSKSGKVAAAFAACAAFVAFSFPDGAMAKAASVVAQPSKGGLIARIMDFALNLDARLLNLFTENAFTAYGALFAVIFCETGLVVAPFLPGDSLLFAAGALSAGGVLNFPFALGLLFVAAVLGDTVNYSIGSWIGARVIAKYPKIFKPSYIEKTKEFYSTHGGKTVVLARFFVIVRTFAPFVAGVANMQYRKFILFNLLGGASWVGSFMTLGYFFGQLPWVEENFALAMMVVVLLSAVPMVVELIKHFLAPKEEIDEAEIVHSIDEIGASFDEDEAVSALS